jgi:hypothetical protein
VLFFFVGSICSAKVQHIFDLPTPSELLTQAGRGPTEFMDVVGQIDAYRPEFRNRDQAQPYVLMLPDLEILAETNQYGEIPMQSFKTMAAKLARHALRWLDLFADDPEIVLKFHAYADEATALQLVEQVQASIKTANAEVGRRHAVANLDQLSIWATQKSLSRFILDSYRETKSDIAMEALSPISVLDDERTRFWLNQLSPQQGYERYLTSVKDWVLSLTPDRAAEYVGATRIVSQMGELIRMNTKSVPQYAHTLVSETAEELVTRMIEAEIPFDDSCFSSLLAALDRSALQSLATTLVSREYVPGSSYAGEYLKRMDQLLKLPQWNEMSREHKQLKRFFELTASALYARIDSLEGTWRLKGSDGKSYIFNAVFSRDNELVFGLGDDGGPAFIYFAFYNVGYNYELQSFVASEAEPDSTTPSNSVVRLQISNGKMTGMLNTRIAHNISFTGVKIGSYEDFLTGGAHVDTDGDYAGTMDCGDWSSKVQLSLTTINGYQTGRMHLDRGDINISLGTGLYENEGNAVYLTTSATGLRSFIQFRAERVGDELVNGQYILGGIGLKCDGVTLKGTH